MGAGAVGAGAVAYPTHGHAPARKPSWASSHTSHTSHETGDQTMQIALGGLGGRNE